MKADPKTSEGARLERKAMRAYLRRKLKQESTLAQTASVAEILDFVLTRQKRYDTKQGGLGK